MDIYRCMSENNNSSRTITVTPAPIAHFVTPPGNITVACGGAGSAPVVSYTNEGSEIVQSVDK
jgi:hypothetical protein